MANRVLRDWTQSENINAISESSEVFFTRLIMKVDDYGCYYGNFKLLKSALYPLREMSFIEIERCLSECAENNLIIRYVVDNKQYIQINNFGQRLRAMRNKFPLPIVSNSPSSDSNSPPETKRNETNPKLETELEIQKKISGYFIDLQNSSFLDSISENNKLTVDQLKSKIPEFKLKANLNYKDFTEFLNHFKNCIPLFSKNNTQIDKPKKPVRTFD
jgi:hypothetical protein